MRKVANPFIYWSLRPLCAVAFQRLVLFAADIGLKGAVRPRQVATSSQGWQKAGKKTKHIHIHAYRQFRMHLSQKQTVEVVLKIRQKQKPSDKILWIPLKETKVWLSQAYSPWSKLSLCDVSQDGEGSFCVFCGARTLRFWWNFASIIFSIFFFLIRVQGKVNCFLPCTCNVWKEISECWRSCIVPIFRSWLFIPHCCGGNLC